MSLSVFLGPPHFCEIFLSFNLAWLSFFKQGYSNLDFLWPLVLSIEKNLCFNMTHFFFPSESFIVIFNLFDNVKKILILQIILKTNLTLVW